MAAAERRTQGWDGQGGLFWGLERLLSGDILLKGPVWDGLSIPTVAQPLYKCS